MKTTDYPLQEPFTEIGASYHNEVLVRGEGISGLDIVHGSNAYQSLAIFSSDKPNGDVLCFMHGGGWTNGYKEWMTFMAPALNALGVTFISLGYRLAPQHVFPAGYDDCCDGLAWVYNNIDKFGGDKKRVFVGGHSAGGHYASLLALRQDWQPQHSLPLNFVKGALPISGTFEFGPASGLSMRPRFLGVEDNNTDIAASPVQYVHKNAPPFLISYGDKDFQHLIRQADDFSDRLSAVQVQTLTLVLAECDHLGASYAAGDIDGAWVRAASSFMRSTQ